MRPLVSSSILLRQQRPQPSHRLSHSALVIRARVLRRQNGFSSIGLTLWRCSLRQRPGAARSCLMQGCQRVPPLPGSLHGRCPTAARLPPGSHPAWYTSPRMAAKKTTLESLARLISKASASADNKFAALAEDIADIKSKMATKDDLAATESECRRHATARRQ